LESTATVSPSKTIMHIIYNNKIPRILMIVIRRLQLSCRDTDAIYPWSCPTLFPQSLRSARLCFPGRWWAWWMRLSPWDLRPRARAVPDRRQRHCLVPVPSCTCQPDGIWWPCTRWPHAPSTWPSRTYISCKPLPTRRLAWHLIYICIDSAFTRFAPIFIPAHII